MNVLYVPVELLLNLVNCMRTLSDEHVFDYIEKYVQIENKTLVDLVNCVYTLLDEHVNRYIYF